jgi:hypothetical protein
LRQRGFGRREWAIMNGRVRSTSSFLIYVNLSRVPRESAVFPAQQIPTVRMSEHSGATSVNGDSASSEDRRHTTPDAAANPFRTPQLSESGHQFSSFSSSSILSRTPVRSSRSIFDSSRQLHFSGDSVGSANELGRESRGILRRNLSSLSAASIRKPYPSTKLREEIPKPWLKYADPAQRWARIIFWSLFALGFAASGVSEFAEMDQELIPKSAILVMRRFPSWVKCKAIKRQAYMKRTDSR